MRDFDPAAATGEEILLAARWLVGKTVAEIGFSDPSALRLPSTAHNKGAVGRVYEEYFNISQNSDPRPDFIGAGIELKSTGVYLHADGETRHKERLSLRMMGTFDPTEEWPTSSLRSKLDHLLIVYYGYRAGDPIGSFPTLGVVHWVPSEDELALLAADWATIRDVWGRGGELSDSLTRVLSASTKGGRDSVTRAFALKPRFNHSIYLSYIDAMPAESLQATFGGSPSFEDEVVEKLREYAGRTVAQVRQAVGRPQSDAKDAQAATIRSLVGLRRRGESQEFERYGLDVKTVPISPDGRAWESMSFSAFLPADLVDASWDESALASQLNRLVIVPLVRPLRETPRDEAIVGRAFLWTPPDALIVSIRARWEAYRDKVMDGHAEDYPRASDGHPIFVNTHGRDATDRVPAPGGFSTARRSFWLHPDVVTSAIVESGESWRGA